MVQATKFCVVCSKLLKNEQTSPIKKELETKLANLSDKLHSKIKENSVVCSGCLEIVSSAYDFKMRCFETEEHLAPHYSENEEIDLKFVAEGENEEEVLEVCRLCFNPLDKHSCSLLNDIIERDANVKKIFQEYIPNMNFVATRKPMICEGCQKSILKFNKLLFLLDNCDIKTNIKEEQSDIDDDNVDAKVENDSQMTDDNESDDNENEEVNIDENLEENKDDEEMIDNHDESDGSFVEEIAIEIVPGDADAEGLVQEGSSELGELKDHGTTKRKEIIKEEQENKSFKSKPTLKENSELDVAWVDNEAKESKSDRKLPVKRFECDICARKIRTRKYLTEHRKSHEHLENCPNRQTQTYVIGKCDFCENQRKVYMCEFCGYRTKVAINFKLHLKSHVPLDGHEEIFKCYLCDFKTGVKNYLAKHIRRMHCDPSEIVWYKCPFCDYKTKDKFFLSRHILVMHEEIDVKDMLKCDKCSFVTKVKDTLKKHIVLKHSNLSEKQTLECDLCDYKTKFSLYLSRHKKNKHTDPQQLKPHVCKHCNLQFKYTQTLRNHMLLKHKNAKEVYKCDLCDFKAQLPRYVRKHYIRIHENPTRKTKSRKAVIHVVTKKRDSV